MNTITKDKDFKDWLLSLKTRIRRSQIKAAIRVNEELLRLYWDLGHDIVVRQMDSEWGSGFFEQLSKELRAEFPEMSGFSSTNLKYCKRFYMFYNSNNQIRHQVGDELGTTNLQQVSEGVQVVDNQTNIIRQQVADELGTTKVHQVGKEAQTIDNKANIIRQQVADELETAKVQQVGKEVQIIDNQTNIIRQQLADELGTTNLQQVSEGVQVVDNQTNIIRQQVADELETAKVQQVGKEVQVVDNQTNIIRHQVGDEFDVSLIFQIPWHHHVQIITKCESLNKFIENLAKDIQSEFPKATGYSVRNLKYMSKFARLFDEFEIVQAALAQITRYHQNVLPSVEIIENKILKIK